LSACAGTEGCVATSTGEATGTAGASEPARGKTGLTSETAR
jgi:hypothetical protein